MRTGAEVVVFVTRRRGAETLIAHRSPEQGGYWHVIAGGVETGETASAAAVRELREETGLVARCVQPVPPVRYAYSLAEEPEQRRRLYPPGVAEVQVTCFHAEAPDDWEPQLDWEHDDHRWCAADDAAASLRWRDTAEALRSVLAAISS